MSLETVFPDMVVGFAETIAKTVELNEQNAMRRGAAMPGPYYEWWKEDVLRVTTACREVREKVETAKESIRQRLMSGVEVASFLATREPVVSRLDSIILRNSATLAEANGLQGPPDEAKEMY